MSCCLNANESQLLTSALGSVRQKMLTSLLCLLVRNVQKESFSKCQVTAQKGSLGPSGLRQTSLHSTHLPNAQCTNLWHPFLPSLLREIRKTIP